MTHIAEHTLELYILAAKEIEVQRTEIEAHLLECEGCKRLVERMTAFYAEAENEILRNPQTVEHPERALVRARSQVEPFYIDDSPALPLRPVTRLQHIQHFVRRHPVMTGSGTFAALAGLALLFNNTVTTLNRDTNPAYKFYNVPQGVIEIRNNKNEVLWTLPSMNLQTLFDDESDRHITHTLVTDLDGDGKNEVLTTLNVGNEENPRTLKIYDEGPTPQRELPFNPPFQYEGKNNYTSKFNPNAFVVRRNEAGFQEIFVAVTNYGRSPAFIARLDVNGEEIGRYWHFGNLGGLYIADVNNDGREEIIAVGINDVNDEKELSFPAIVVLDPSKIVGDKKPTAAPRFDFPFSDAELYYIRLPLSDIHVALKENGSVSALDMSRTDVFDFVLRNRMNGQDDDFVFDFIFTRGISPLEVKSATSTDRIHALLVQKGELTGTIDTNYLESLKQGIRYWDGKEWRKEVVKVNHGLIVKK